MTREEWAREFGKRLTRKIKSKNMTQEKLANVTGISQAAISKYTLGSSIPSGYKAFKICKALNCSIDELTNF